MKTLISLLALICFGFVSCEPNRKPYYRLEVIEYYSDSTQSIIEDWILKCVSSANHQNSLETHKRSVHIIDDARQTAEQLFVKEQELGLAYVVNWQLDEILYIREKDMTPEQRKIFEKLKKETQD